jgi:hypothetical protein
VYESEITEAEALKNFVRNLEISRIQNEKFIARRSNFKCGIWLHFDLDLKTFVKYLTGFRGRPKFRSITSSNIKKGLGSVFIPSSLNYTQQGYVTKVMYQGWCGSCW